MIFIASIRRGLVGSTKIGSPLRRHLQWNAFRIYARNNSSWASSAPKSPAGRYLYPENLCIYHGGTGRTSFLAICKLGSIFFAVGFASMAGPAIYEKCKKEGGWVLWIPLVNLVALTPMLVNLYLMSPFVTVIHMRLPTAARCNEATLREFLRKLSPRTELNITTMNPIAKLRVSHVQVGDLKPTKARMGIVNYTRDTKAENATRKWYHFRALGNFSTPYNKGKYVWVWDEVVKAIAKHHKQQSTATKQIGAP